MRPHVAIAWICLAVTAPARAFQSECYVTEGSTQKCGEGPQAARDPARWLGEGDEHRELWSTTAGLAGIPPALSDDPIGLEVFTGPADVDVAGQQAPSVRPVEFIEATRRQARTISVAELAQLPDFSYALWDWALGNETCPLNAELDEQPDAAGCHSFTTHMGAVNSNHFLPQARRFFAHYHALALEKAADCAVMAGRFESGGASDRPEFAPFLRDCEREAMVLESVGHHFLQDAWSTGHMWERWGSPDIGDFIDRTDALLIAATAGLIHGARAVLQPLIESRAPGVQVNDALCFPRDEVRWTLGAEQAPVGGVGDLFLDRLSPVDASFADQYHQAFSCLTSAMREVYLAAGQQHGPIGVPPDTTLATVDPESDACFAQRATNTAMRHAAGIDLDTPAGSLRLPLEPFVIARVLPFLIDLETGGGGPLSGVRAFQYRAQITLITARLAYFARTAPDGTEAASGQLGSLLGADPNGAFVNNDPIASYIDPPLPWPLPSRLREESSADLPDPPDRALLLARAFHRGHAMDWCRLFRDGSPDRLDVLALRQRVQDLAGAGEDTDVPCAVCVEFARRHLRVGTPEEYDTTREPLCFFLADGGAAQLVYQEGSPAEDVDALAGKFCGCEGPTTTTTTTTLPPIVHISGFAFVPSTLGVGRNSMVTWVNDDIAMHSVVADNSSFSSPLLSKNESFTRTFSTAGSVGYHCGQHPGEQGTIDVAP